METKKIDYNCIMSHIMSTIANRQRQRRVSEVGSGIVLCVLAAVIITLTTQRHTDVPQPLGLVEAGLNLNSHDHLLLI